jgi:hypothetical protein
LEAAVDALMVRLNKKPREWRPENAETVRQQIVELINMSDQDALDLIRSRAVEQEVLDLLDEPAPR